METRRFIKSALFITLALIMVSTLLPRNVYAWGNVEAHPEINRLAIQLFQQRVNSESSLAIFKNTSLDGDLCRGMAWDVADGNALIQRKASTSRQKTLANWIIDGGYSADEPESPAALRHFYDPVSKGHLTDTDWIAGFLRLTLGTQAVNPEISAVEWAMNEDEGAGKMDVFFSQDYSYPDAKEYFKQALADKSRDNPSYGNAWRAVGETMHLVADMGLAPHVRNDGHGLGDTDPVEGATTAAIINQYNDTNWTSTINYDQSVRGLMHELAAYTNKNFFSKDTIPVAGKTTTANGRPAYPNPSITSLTVSKSGYLEGKVDGVTVKLARQSGWYRWGLSKNPGFVIDGAVIKDQQRILNPTIIRASEAVLERFLPRFEVRASMKQDPDSPGRYTVIGGINFKPSAEWSERLTIRNGAYVVLNGKKEAVKLVNQDDLNEFSYSITGKSGDQVQVIYDLGGYVIKSEIFKIGGLVIDPATLSGETNKDYTFKAVTTSAPASPRYEWYVNESLKQKDASASFNTKFTAQGEYTIRAKLFDSAGKEVATATSKATIEEKSANKLSLLQKQVGVQLNLTGIHTYKVWQAPNNTANEVKQGNLSCPQNFSGEIRSMPISWSGTGFTGKFTSGEMVYTVNGNVSADGATLTNLTYSFVNNHKGTYQYSDQTVKITVAGGIPIWGIDGKPSNTISGADIAKYNISISDIYNNYYTGGEKRDTRNYVSSDWTKGTIRLSFVDKLDDFVTGSNGNFTVK
jgi:hypothetical protein